MPHTTTCPMCGFLYEESSEEAANDPFRLCPGCDYDEREEFMRQAEIEKDI